MDTAQLFDFTNVYFLPEKVRNMKSIKPNSKRRRATKLFFFLLKTKIFSS